MRTLGDAEEGIIMVKWIEGKPKEAMWCLGTYLSEDKPPRQGVTYLWFNPQATHKWWIGAAGQSRKFYQPVTHYMELPRPSNKTEDKQ